MDDTHGARTKSIGNEITWVWFKAERNGMRNQRKAPFSPMSTPQKQSKRSFTAFGLFLAMFLNFHQLQSKRDGLLCPKYTVKIMLRILQLMWNFISVRYLLVAEETGFPRWTCLPCWFFGWGSKGWNPVPVLWERNGLLSSWRPFSSPRYLSLYHGRMSCISEINSDWN